MRSSLISSDLRTLCLSLYSGRQDCEVIRLSAVPGVYQAPVPVQGGEGSATGDIGRIRSGTYTAAVWGADADGNSVAFGCRAQPVRIEVGRRAEVEIVLEANPDFALGRPCPQ